MEEEAFDPDSFLATFALAGLFRGWLEIYDPDQSNFGGTLAIRLFGLVMLGGLALDCRSEGLAWASVLHFVLKYLGSYHGCRLIAWSIAVALAALGWIKPKPTRLSG